MKTAIVLSVYNKIDDLLVHLDILKYDKFREIIITNLNPDLPHMDKLSRYRVVPVDGVGFYLGALLSLVAGVKEAHKLGIDYLCYRNADDWLFNHAFTESVFLKMKTRGFLCAGYNWFSKNYNEEFAMNELYIDVNKFADSTHFAEDYFRNSKNDQLCEWKIAKWINYAIGDWSRFYRLSARESHPGVGHDWSALQYIYKYILGTEMPKEVSDRYYRNNRFYHKEWQLIGCHSNIQRHIYWEAIRDTIPYATELESQPEFTRWLKACELKETWNLPNSEDHIENRVVKPMKKMSPRRLIMSK